MPITRRRRAASPSEENTTQTPETTTQAGEQNASAGQETPETGSSAPEHAPTMSALPVTSDASPLPESAPVERKRRIRSSESSHVGPVQPGPAIQESAPPEQEVQRPEQGGQMPQDAILPAQQAPSSSMTQTSTIGMNGGGNTNNGNVGNGERGERSDFSAIEPGRRTARGELFRRPPQIPPQHVQQVTPNQPPSQVVVQPSGQRTPQTPTHEITLPLGNLLHLAYNPGYTGAEEARSSLLQKLTNESKAGGRARCWNCGSLAIMYDRWNTRSKTFGEIGVAICEICGVWSVM